jgi:glycosyltransferase involved in cell wall biosynthesis
MAEVLPIVCIFGALRIELHSPQPVPHFEASRLDCRCYLTDDDLYGVLAKDRPAVIVTFGNSSDFKNLMSAPWSIRKRWLNFENTNDLKLVGSNAFECYLQNATESRGEIPLVTVFTPTYKTGEKIMRPFDSLRNQTYPNWEWVIMDDSDDDGETFEMLSELANSDSRIRLYKEYRHSGCIGSLKRDACMISNGEFLVELDHDDELTPRALELVVKAYQKYPEVGFVYTDFAECFEDGSPVSYGQDKSRKPPYSDWGFGYGSYREEVHGGHKYMVANSPNVNPKTIRHIVAAPNHIRSWRRSVYLEMGGHSQLVHVADDYEIMVRTFLTTRMCRVPEMCYVQYRNFGVGNTHQSRNQEIQRLVRYFSHIYDERIHERFLELGVDDFVWQEGKNTFYEMNQIINQPVEGHCTIIYEEDK